KRFRPEHFQVALVNDVPEQVRLRFEARAEPLDELPVLFLVLAFDHDDEFIGQGKLFFEAKEILVILLVPADEVVPARIELKMLDRVVNAEGCEQHLRIEKPARISDHGIGQSSEEFRRQVFPSRSHDLSGDSLRPAPQESSVAILRLETPRSSKPL